VAKITPVLMSGGAGTRLWPISRRARPKQFHALVRAKGGGERTLIQDTVLRVTGEAYGPPMVVCNRGHADLVREQLGAVGVTPRALILEPEGRNTGPAAAVAALAAQAQGCDLVLLLSADARVADPDALNRAVAQGAAAAEAGSLVIFGVTPTSPETGYGYIRARAAADSEGAPVRPVAAFVEKPDLETARQYLLDPAFSWNAGIFLFRPDALLAEARRLAPDLVRACETALKEAPAAGDTIRLGPAFRSAPAVAVDVAVFEKTDKAVVVAADIGWSDVGTYEALWGEAAKTSAGDVLQGPAIVADTRDSLVMSDGPAVVLSGVEGLAVIVQDGVVLVTRKDDPAAVRAAVAAVRKAGREDLL
jgi:mannose-1-phosphate guanylyltransferase/mannose-6-phosphate isomerase